jgi:hypothetical protein
MELLLRNFMPAHGQSGAFRIHSYRMFIDKRAKNLKTILYQALVASLVTLFWLAEREKGTAHARRPSSGQAPEALSVKFVAEVTPLRHVREDGPGHPAMSLPRRRGSLFLGVARPRTHSYFVDMHWEMF